MRKSAKSVPSQSQVRLWVYVDQTQKKAIEAAASRANSNVSAWSADIISERLSVELQSPPATARRTVIARRHRDKQRRFEARVHVYMYPQDMADLETVSRWRNKSKSTLVGDFLVAAAQKQ